MRYPHGMFTWADAAVPDLAAGVAFYRGIFGWESDEIPGYVMFRREGAAVAGMGQLREERRAEGFEPLWSSYVNVESADVIAHRAADLGATVLVDPMDIPGAGRMTYVADPTGARIGFWQPGGHEGAGSFNEEGDMAWNELVTDDPVRAAVFYSELLPWKVTEQGDPVSYRTVNLEGRPNGGITAGGADRGGSRWVVYFAVGDADAVVNEAILRGGSVTAGPFDTPFGRVAGLVDDQGAAFGVIRLTQEDSEPAPSGL